KNGFYILKLYIKERYVFHKRNLYNEVLYMNYTPEELQNLVFKKSVVGGYNEDMVNDVLDKIIEDYTNYIRENIELKDKIAALNEALQYYKNIEDSLKKTLMVAQKTSEEMEKNSYQKSENIIKEAEIKAQEIINEAK